MEEDKEISSLNVIPLVDIMLVLLTITLVGATFIAVGKLRVELPKVKGKALKEKVITLTLTQRGQIYYEGKRVSLKTLKRKLKKFSKKEKVVILADKKVKVEELVRLLSFLKDLGFKNVSLGVKNF